MAISIQPLILAAGKGTRMKTDLPKVLCPIAGKPMLAHVLATAQRISNGNACILVVGYGADQIAVAFPDELLVEQKQQLGTGHAVLMAADEIDPTSCVLVLYGDVPLISAHTLESVLVKANKGGIGLLTAILADPTGYGRIIRDAENKVLAVVEHKDATEEQCKVTEVNTGILAAKGEDLIRWVKQLSNNNAQSEYYLTDIIAMAVEEGLPIDTTHSTSETEVKGANDREQLAELERAFQRQQADALMRDGTTIFDPSRLDIRGNLKVGEGVIIDVNTVFEGNVELGNNVVVEPNCYVKNSSIGDNTIVRSFCHIEGATLGQNVVVGPYARLREGSELADGSKVGNFVETKEAKIGKGSKINHLSYVGDAEVGKDVNIGAGTITCNYDGANKHKTEIGDGVFVGSNTALVAPVKVGENATIAAGSTVTEDIAENDLAIARSKQTHIKSWKRPTKN